VTVTVANSADLGIIRGIVRDEGGSPISDATVAIFRLGTSKLLKQVQSAADGSFLAKILPGTYTVLAVAQGFNPVTLSDVEVNKAADVIYGFRLERAGEGNTLPEKRADRNSSKWRIRAAAMQRSIYQNRAGKAPVDESAEAEDQAPDTAARSRVGQSVVETYFADTAVGNYAGVNFATLVPVGEDTTIVFAGQAGKGRNAPLRLETDLKFKPYRNHQVRLNTSFGVAGVNSVQNDNALGQFSLQATDEWKFRDGVILVLGFDYSKFTGAGDDSSITPRLGLQFDVNSKTRVRSAFTAQTDERTWSKAVDLEGAAVTFRDTVSVQDLVVSAHRPKMNKSTRLEFGVERVLDNRSSVEMNAFFDATLGRGVGLNAFSFDSLGSNSFDELVANQQGGSHGLRFVYSRRVSGPLTMSAGYSLGTGQKISTAALTNPSEVFETGFFQSFFGQITADLKTGTSVKTVFRLSPQATVFAIDPFQGRLAIYDPGLSVFITQNLPTLGLPIRAEAIIDGRNLFDFQGGIRSDEGGLRLSGQRRTLRGGILVRF
ncbi:MAG: carboxypeptidase-like regulatory domain-containing protein, partial [Acidobacteriota bacterium]